jgi:hypothetical protein
MTVIIIIIKQTFSIIVTNIVSAKFHSLIFWLNRLIASNKMGSKQYEKGKRRNKQ